MLDKENKDIILNHLNMRLKSIDLSSCGFCQVAKKLMYAHNRDNTPLDFSSEIDEFCPHCPLQIAGHEKSFDCLTCRQDNLRDTTDGMKTEAYETATEDSILEHVGYMMEKANKFWGINLYWKHNENNDTEIVDVEEVKNESV